MQANVMEEASNNIVVYKTITDVGPQRNSARFLQQEQAQCSRYAPLHSGTLIANWYEERVHRDNKGQGRAMTKTHLPKQHNVLLAS